VPFFLFFPHERKEEAPGGRFPCGGRKTNKPETTQTGRCGHRPLRTRHRAGTTLQTPPSVIL